MKVLRYFFGALVVVFVDRITKLMALRWCLTRCSISSFLRFDVVFNRGISWGLFHGNSPYQFYLVTAAITIITFWLLHYALQRFREGFLIWGETLIIAGSFSNICDRLWYGGVIDFIEFFYAGWSWPVFNTADICIVFGVFLLVVEQYRS